MILACDQYEQIVQIAWGEDPEEVQVEEYEVQEEAVHRIQELMERAERVVITQESSLASELEGRGIVVTRIPRLYAVYWGLRDQANGGDCLILSIGQNSCVGGVVKEGCLVRQEVGSPDLALHGIWRGWVEGNPPLRRAVEAYLRGKELSEAEREVFQGFLKALRGRRVQSPIPFSPPLKLPQVVKPLQEFLTQFDPQREMRTLILTDWAAYGSLPELLRRDSQVLCSGDNSLTDAVRGMVLFGWEGAEVGQKPAMVLTGDQGEQETEEAEQREDGREAQELYQLAEEEHLEEDKLDLKVEEVEPRAELSVEVEEGVGESAEKVETRRGRPFALFLFLCALTGILIGLFLMLQRPVSMDKTTEELKEKDKKIADLEKMIESLRNTNAGSGEIRHLQEQLARLKEEINKGRQKPTPPVQSSEGREYIQKMISYASVDGGANRESEIVGAKRRVEELNVKNRLTHGNRKKARKHNERGLGYIQNWQFADAVQAFQEAYQTDPADIEIINNLGHAHMKNGDLDAAEQFLLRALVISPDRSSAWADLGQTYAKQGKTTDAVGCFANAYRFSRDQNKTYRFLQGLVEKNSAKVRDAAKQALQLELVKLPSS